FDVVDESNLQRQIIHGTSDVGRRKTESARETLAEINPHVNVELHETRLTSGNALDILAGYDIIADGTDNFPTRYLVNDACVLLGKPNAYGSIFRFEGQVSVFCHADGPCYRCLYPEPPPPGMVPSCAEGGVLGILPGLVGVMQATEVVKLVLGAGEPLVGRLLLVDALAMRFREMKIRRAEECPVCGSHPTIHELIDYEAFCGVGAEEPEVAPTGSDAGPESDAEPAFEIQAAELGARLGNGGDVVLVDVRTPEEYRICRIEGSELIPLMELPDRLERLDASREMVVYCHTGIRSAQAVGFLRRVGFPRARNLSGGIEAWSRDVDPSVPRY
ncbi:ThiF family adenylyltransferase, partial [bacterium]|nr:ThiF family adenylyltransferase [bacterium]